MRGRGSGVHCTESWKMCFNGDVAYTSLTQQHLRHIIINCNTTYINTHVILLDAFGLPSDAQAIVSFRVPYSSP